VIWFPLALVAAMSSATNDVLSKRFFGHLSPYEMGLIRLLYAFPYLLVALFLIPWPLLDGVFWSCLAVGLPLEAAAFITYMKAIKTSPLSLTLPFLAFTPVFTIFTGYFLLGETLSANGMLGIFLILIGSFTLHFSLFRKAWLAPLKAIAGERGSMLMLLTAFLYSLTSTLGKLAIQHSSQPFFAATYFLAFFLLVSSLYPFLGKGTGRLAERPFAGVLAGSIFALMIFTHTLAISMVEAAYMLSVKRSSVVFGVVMGALFFKEEKVAERFLGSLIMLSGVCLIGVWG
jgi:drug/metabolite transporter (DMT)-like permease